VDHAVRVLAQTLILATVHASVGRWRRVRLRTRSCRLHRLDIQGQDRVFIFLAAPRTGCEFNRALIRRVAVFIGLAAGLRDEERCRRGLIQLLALHHDLVALVSLQKLLLRKPDWLRRLP